MWVTQHQESPAIESVQHCPSESIASPAVELQIATDRKQAVGSAAGVGGKGRTCRIDNVVVRQGLCPVKIAKKWQIVFKNLKP